MGMSGKPGRGGYDSAKETRLTEGWTPGDAGPSIIHQQDATSLRNRCRDLYRNNPIARSAIDAYKANVVECGITPDPMLPDGGDRNLWLAAWEHWAAKEADATGQQHLNEMQGLWLQEVLIAGGCIVHPIVLPSRKSRGRSIPLTIELIPEERISNDSDFMHGHTIAKGHQIIRGVEIDAIGKPVAYWIKPTAPNDLTSTFATPERIPAEQLEYGFIKDRIGEYRGFSILAAVVQLLWSLDYYTDNEMMASAIKSCYAAVITTETPIDGISDGEDTEDDNGNAFEALQPGIVAHLKPGEDISGIGPNVPGGDSTPWLMMILRAIASGSDLSYETLTRDHTKGSFSSTRQSANADKRRFRKMQKFVINHFLSPIYPLFVEWAVQAGLEGFPTPAQFAAERDEWLKVKWRRPGWASVNPVDDAKAFQIERENGVASRGSYLADRSGTVEEVFDDLQREDEAAKEKGIIVDGTNGTITQQQEPNAAEAG
jgi:lambda family phage portal protein